MKTIFSKVNLSLLKCLEMDLFPNINFTALKGKHCLLNLLTFVIFFVFYNKVKRRIMLDLLSKIF